MLRSGNAPLHVENVTAAGSTQADAATIPSKASLALVVAAGDNTKGILLPKASKGKAYFVKNSGAGGLKVYPSGTNAINALGGSNAITMAANTSALFVAATSALWYTVPLLPS